MICSRQPDKIGSNKAAQLIMEMARSSELKSCGNYALDALERLSQTKRIEAALMEMDLRHSGLRVEMPEKGVAHITGVLYNHDGQGTHPGCRRKNSRSGEGPIGCHVGACRIRLDPCGSKKPADRRIGRILRRSIVEYRGPVAQLPTRREPDQTAEEIMNIIRSLKDFFINLFSGKTTDPASPPPRSKAEGTKPAQAGWKPDASIRITGVLSKCPEIGSCMDSRVSP